MHRPAAATIILLLPIANLIRIDARGTTTAFRLASRCPPATRRTGSKQKSGCPAAKREAEEGIHPVASVGQGVVVGAVWKRAKQAAAIGILPKTLGLLPMLLARADEVIE